MTFDVTQAAQVSSGAFGLAWLLELDFDSGTIYLCNHNEQIVTGGHTYTGLGEMLTVSQVKEKPGTTVEKLSVTIPSNPAYNALALGNVEGYRGRAGRLYLQLLDESYQPVSTPKLRMSGFMEPVSISREPAREGSSSGRIEMRISRQGLERSRRTDGARLTDSQQRAKYSGDTGLRYVRTLIEKPSLWLSVAFQKQ